MEYLSTLWHPDMGDNSVLDSGTVKGANYV